MRYIYFFGREKMSSLSLKVVYRRNGRKRDHRGYSEHSQKTVSIGRLRKEKTVSPMSIASEPKERVEIERDYLVNVLLLMAMKRGHLFR